MLFGYTAPGARGARGTGWKGGKGDGTGTQLVDPLGHSFEVRHVVGLRGDLVRAVGVEEGLQPVLAAGDCYHEGAVGDEAGCEGGAYAGGGACDERYF